MGEIGAKKRRNQALEPTPLIVTIHACARLPSGAECGKRWPQKGEEGAKERAGSLGRCRRFEWHKRAAELRYVLTR